MPSGLENDGGQPIAMFGVVAVSCSMLKATDDVEIYISISSFLLAKQGV